VKKKVSKGPMKRISSPDWLDDPDMIVFATERAVPPWEESYSIALANGPVPFLERQKKR
jgi:hypothetical protein